MKEIISCCGVVCTSCEYYPEICAGCPAIEEKPSGLSIPAGQSVIFINAVFSRRSFPIAENVKSWHATAILIPRTLPKLKKKMKRILRDRWNSSGGWNSREDKKMQFSDIPELARLYYQFWRETSDVEAMKRQFRRLEKTDTHILLCEEDDSRLIGSVMGIICEELYGDCHPLWCLKIWLWIKPAVRAASEKLCSAFWKSRRGNAIAHRSSWWPKKPERCLLLLWSEWIPDR